MRHSRRTVLAALAVTLCASPVAAAHEPRGGAVVAPAHGGGLSGGELLAASWANVMETPPGANPDAGGCATIARDVLDAFPGPDGIARCTGTQRTRLLVGFGTECSNLDPPSFFETEADQRACAVAGDQGFEELNVTVDDGDTINLVRPRFELISPQTTVELPPDNIFHSAAPTATFTAHAWGAVVRKLRPGQHSVTVEVVNPDFGPPFSFTIVLDVVRSGKRDG
jgi:hypothetical protein